MELRSRTEALLRPQAPTAFPPSTRSTQLLASLERDTATRRWLRGVMCVLAAACFFLSVIDTGALIGDLVVHLFMLLLALAAEVCVYHVYRIKARFAGFTNAARPAARTYHVLHSPHAGAMALEMVVWLLQAPPGLRADTAAAGALDSLVLLRAYVFVLYFTQVSSRDLFVRVVAALSGFRFSSSNFVRNSLLLGAGAGARAAVMLAGWLCASLLYSKGEGVGLYDASFFCLNTASFVGYGDATPYTYLGRLAAVLSWALGALAFLWCITFMHASLTLSSAERHAYNLFKTNKLCARTPGEAARVIQRAWKLYCAKRDGRSGVAVQFNAYWLTQQAAAYRELRREFAQRELFFLRSTATFRELYPRAPSGAGGGGGLLSTRSSQASSPALTPRGSRRPFSLFQDVKPKTPLASPRVAGAATTAAAMAAADGRPESAFDRALQQQQQQRQRSPPSSVLFPAEPPAAGGGQQQQQQARAGSDPAALTRRLEKLEETMNGLIEQAQQLCRKRGIHSGDDEAAEL